MRGRPADLMGGADDTSDEDESFGAVLPSPSDLLGAQQADELSGLLATGRLPWNQHPRWQGDAVMVLEIGDLPVITLDGGLRLTLLGPTLARLYQLCSAWPDVLGGIDEPTGAKRPCPADLLGRRDNLAAGLEGRRAARPVGRQRLKHHAARRVRRSCAAACRRRSRAGSRGRPRTSLATSAMRRQLRCRSRRSSCRTTRAQKNLTRAVLEKIDCSRYLISTDGSNHGHPDHQALLRILRYSKRSPQLLFNYAGDTTLPWRDSKSDILNMGFRDYATRFPAKPADGLILELDSSMSGHGGRHSARLSAGDSNMVSDDDDPRAPYKVYEGDECKGTYPTFIA